MSIKDFPIELVNSICDEVDLSTSIKFREALHIEVHNEDYLKLTKSKFEVVLHGEGGIWERYYDDDDLTLVDFLVILEDLSFNWVDIECDRKYLMRLHEYIKAVPDEFPRNLYQTFPFLIRQLLYGKYNNSFTSLLVLKSCIWKLWSEDYDCEQNVMEAEKIADYIVLTTEVRGHKKDWDFIQEYFKQRKLEVCYDEDGNFSKKLLRTYELRLECDLYLYKWENFLFREMTDEELIDELE